MLKRRNLKVLAAAIGVSVMSGLYASPVWAANIGQDTGNLGYPTNAEGSVIQVNNGGISLTVDASDELKNSATQVTITKDNGVVITSNTQNGTATSSVSLKEGNITATGTLSVGGVELNGTDISGLKEDVANLKQKTTTITYSDQGTNIGGALNVASTLSLGNRYSDVAAELDKLTAITYDNVNGTTVGGALTVNSTFEAKGDAFVGNLTVAGGEAYIDTNGNIATNGELKVAGGKAYIDTNGNIATNGELKVAGGEAYIDTNGNIATNGELKVAGGKAYIDTNGNIATNGELKVAGGKAYIDDDGAMKLASGKFAVDSDGNMATLGGLTAANKRFAIDGATGEIKTAGGLSVGSGNLVVDEQGNLKTNGTLGAAGGNFAVKEDGSIVTNANMEVKQNAVVGGTLNVKGNADFDANVNVDGTVTADKVVTNRVELGTTVVKEEGFYMKDANGNHTTKLEEGRLQVKSETGDISTVVKSEGVFVKSDDNTTVSKLTQEGLDVGGNFTVDAATGNTKIGGTLDVAGATTLASTLNVKDNADFDKNVNVDGRLDVADGASIKDGEGGMLNVTDDGVGLHSDKNDTSTLSVTKNGVGMSSNQAISMNAAGATMSLSANGIGMHEGNSAATVTDAGIGLTTAKTSVTVTDNGATFIADKNVAEYTNINGDEVTVTDGTNKTVVGSADVSITNPDPNSTGRINLSDLGQIDDLDGELKARDEYTSTVNNEGNGTAVGAINAEAAIRREEVARLDNRIDKVEDRLDKVGAMTAAIANLRTMGYDPLAPSEFAMSLGQYRDETGMALGFFHYPNRDFMLSFSVSTAGDEYMGGIGATWKFGRKTPEQLAEEIKAKEAKKALAKAEAERKAAVAAKVRVQQAKHAEMQ